MGAAGSVSSAAAGHGLGEASFGGSRPPLPQLIAQEVYRRERKGTKTEARHWFLKQPEAPVPPSPTEVGGTFVAWASLERSCDFQDWGCGPSTGKDLY